MGGFNFNLLKGYQNLGHNVNNHRKLRDGNMA